ncbi:MAG: hypothetical protein ACXAEN_20060, partial [Candidatus Thorarchaeota archaeon]
YVGHFDTYVTNVYTYWNIRFYANDSNGIESVSEEYILRVVFSKPDPYTPGQETLGTAIIIAIPIMLLVAAVIIKKRS